MTRLFLLVCVAVGALGAGTPLTAQRVDESRLLREAAARESRGDFDGAERVLRRLLQASPASSGGLFALERVLRAKGDPRSILPAADTFLAFDPSSAGVRTLKLRVLVELDSLAALEAEARRWFDHEPRSEAPYREVSRVWERVFGPARALEVLRLGRERTGNPDALALEIGDLLTVTGDVAGAVEEWARSVGSDGADAGTIARRVAGLQDDSKAAATRIVSILAGAPDAGRRRAGALIALDLGLEPESLRLVQQVASTMDGPARVDFLADVAGRARARALGPVAAWAYAELGEEAGSPAERREFDQRVVEISLADGDTARAVEAQRRVVDSYTPGSADRRRATARWITLQAAAADTTRLRELLGTFRQEFPSAPELDDLGATVAAALLARGDAPGAAAVLEGIQGARSSMQRGYLLLDAGHLEEGRRALLMAVSGLEPTAATEVIQFAGLLGRLSPEGAALLAKAGVLAHGGKQAEGVQLLTDGAQTLPTADVPPLLAEGARMAERGGLDELAADLRRRILDDVPDAPEASGAALSLARYLARGPDGRAEAIRILEDLVSRTPNAAVAPDARRELEKLRRSS
jgi:tetratricopeptide (TPR) repeat protein